MQKLTTLLLFNFILVQSFAQKQKEVNTYLLAGYSKTLYDRTLGNNPWGMGLALQAFLTNKTKFKPIIEITGDIYLEDDKVFRADFNGTPIDDVSSMVNLFIGSSFNPSQNIYISLLAGPSFINGQVLAGVEPSLGFYFSKRQRWTGKISYINIFNRDKTTKEDFGTLSFAIGLKLF